MKDSNNKFHRGRFAYNKACSVAIGLIVISVFFLSGCYLNAGAGSDNQSAKNQATTKAQDKAQDKAQGKGSFKVVYTPVKNPDYADLQKELKGSKALEGIAEDLNKTFTLPVDVTISFAECGEINAFYDPQKRRVQICYEMVERFAELFSENSSSQEDAEDAIVGATIFVFYHELGHALINVLDLPVTGKEEDAVDQLSTYILTDGTDEGEKAALDGASTFILEEQANSDIDSLPFWDEHSLDLQRFYNIVCWVYGQNEQKYAFLVSEDVLPEDRAVRCKGEYAQIEKSWSTLLAPHLKQ